MNAKQKTSKSSKVYSSLYFIFNSANNFYDYLACIPHNFINQLDVIPLQIFLMLILKFYYLFISNIQISILHIDINNQIIACFLYSKTLKLLYRNLLFKLSHLFVIVKTIL